MDRTPPAAFRSVARQFFAMLLAATASLATATAYAGEDKPDNTEWKKRFHEVYRLGDGETVKFVPAPFIPERANYLRPFASGPIRFGGQLAFAWDDTKKGDARLIFQSFSGGSGNVTSGFFDCGELTSNEAEYEGKDEDRWKPMDGDWIFRKSASRQDRVKAVGKIATERAKLRVSAEKKKEDREVLVATGRLVHKKMKGTRNADAIHFYTNELDRQEGGGGGGGSGRLSEWLVRVGDYTHYRVIDETKSSNEKVVWVNHMSAQVHDRNPNWLDQMLKNLRDQTGLEFKFERRPVELWVIRVGEAAEEKDPPKEGL